MNILIKKLMFFAFCLTLVLFFCVSCSVSLKPHERVYIKAPEMQMDIDAGKNFQQYVNNIREGSVTTGSSKGGGGCGCN